MKGDLKMRKLTKRQITAAKKIVESLNIAVKLHLETLVEFWAKSYVGEKYGTYDYYGGAIWGTLDTLEMTDAITLKQFFLLKDYYDEMRWQKVDELREKGAA